MAFCFLRKATTFTTTSTATSAAASPLLLNLLFRQKLPTLSITNRFLRVTPTTPTSTNIPVGGSSDDDDEDDPELVNSTAGLLTFKGPPKFFESYNNILQRQGQRKPLSVDETEEGMVLRITMPGVEEEGCKILMKEKNVVQIVAEAEKWLEPTLEPPRKYSLSLEFRPEMHRAEDLHANVKNGIMKIFVPKVRKDGNGRVKDEEDREVVPYVFEGKDELGKN